MRRRDLVVGVVAAGAALIVAGGVAWSAIPDGSGVINACYTKVGGIVRVIDTAKSQKCASAFEVPLSWNQQGIKGDPGAPGAPGQKGDPGPAGPSDAYTNYGGDLQLISNGTTQTVASVTLPAGSYTLSGSATAVKTSNDDTHAQCSFVALATVHGQASLLTMEKEQSDRVPVIGDVTIASGSTSVFLRCTALDGDVKAAGELIATKVGTVTASS